MYFNCYSLNILVSRYISKVTGICICFILFFRIRIQVTDRCYCNDQVQLLFHKVSWPFITFTSVKWSSASCYSDLTAPYDRNPAVRRHVRLIQLSVLADVRHQLRQRPRSPQQGSEDPSQAKSFRHKKHLEIIQALRRNRNEKKEKFAKTTDEKWGSSRETKITSKCGTNYIFRKIIERMEERQNGRKITSKIIS